MLTDSHAHLDNARYDADREAMLKAALQAGVGTVLSIGIGDGPDTMHRALDLCREYAGRTDVPRLYATAGVHPDDAAKLDDAALDKLNKLLAEPGVIACGEIGLDYYWDTAPRAVQQEAFIEQMECAAGHCLPIVIHCRAAERAGAGDTAAWDDTLDLLDRHWRQTGLGGILHCFAGTAEHARRAIDWGFLISFAGNITFPKAQAIRDAAQALPLTSVLVETDAPFLAPVPMRGQRNEPAYVTGTAAKLAELLNVDAEEIAQITTHNFEKLMRIAS
ncbi:MAG TPA: TatD family hydrolase [Acidobacteriaceae bacterium]|nr:TatD family hydrolase [Acidobacteriaceae bacterium]